MSSHQIRFLPHNRTITVSRGKNLIRAAMDAGVHINASCGGEGVCGKCRIMVEKGAVTGGESERISQADINAGYRLACKSKIREDVTIRVPIESQVDASVLNRPVSPRKTARIREMNLDELKERGLFVPPVEKIYLELPPPDAQDHLPDVTRLVSFLALHHDLHRLQVDLAVIRKIPDIFRENDFKITATLLKPLRKDSGRTRIINIQAGDTTDRNFAAAVDIGTTTIYTQIVNLITGDVLSQCGDFNGQISYGEDVITRIMMAEKPGGLEKLNARVVDTINRVVGRAVKLAKIDSEDVSTITLAGNTTMTQLFMRVNPRYIRRAPYVPAATLYPPVSSRELGLNVGEHQTALVYPAVSSYVGGDIVAGVMGCGLYRSEKLTLFMDIGTNAEVVVGNRDWMACAACSAGPAFEGGGIEFGMRAAKGAIEDFLIDPVTFEPMLITIGNVRPKGICGSGLINMTALLFETGVIDHSGKFDRELDTKRIRKRNGVYEYVLAWKEESMIGRDIVLTEIDIENLIRAKGAIYSGFVTLLEEVGHAITDIDRIILAGGFGSFVDLEKAMTIGLLPETDPEQVIFVGNGSLLGAKMSALTNRIRKDVIAVTRNMTNFELSETASYMDHYVGALFLPHTNLNLFPRLKKRLFSRK